MAEFEYVPDPVADTNESPTTGDYAKTVGASVTGGVLAPAAASARYATEDSPTNTGRFVNEMSRILQRHLNTATDDINESRTEVARKRAEAAVTSSEFWEHPVSAGMLKAAGMTGPMAAAIFSGGPVGAALVSGALAEGSYLDEVDKKLDAASDADLRQNSYYESLRAMGMDEQAARSGLKKQIIGNQDVANFVVGAVAGALGPAGKLAAGVSGKAAVGLASEEAGLGARAALGAVEGAVGGAAQGGTENYTVQQTGIDAGLQKTLDKDALVNAVLEPALIGGATGAAAGAAVGGKGKRKAAEIKARKEQPLDDVAPEAAAESGSGTEVPPVETAPVGNKQNEPAGTPQAYPKAEAAKDKGKAKVKGPAVETVEVGAPSAEQAVAMADVQQPAAPEPAMPAAPQVPPQVAEAAKRVTSPAAPEPALAAPTPEAVPPQIAEAARRVNPDMVPPEVTAPQVAPDVRAPIEAPVQVEVKPAPPEAVATPQPVDPVAPKQTGRILPNLSPEAKANQRAQNEQLNKAVRKIQKAEDGPGTKNYSDAEKGFIAERAKHAEEIFSAHVKDREMPTTREQREAMVADLDKILEAAASRGLVLRENLPEGTAGGSKEFHYSVPEKVGDKAMSPHVRYLREVAGVRKALQSNAFGPKSKNRARVLDFINEERARDLEGMANRRKIEGAAAKEQYQGDVEAKAGNAVGDGAREDALSPEERMIAREEEEGLDQEEAPAPAKRAAPPPAKKPAIPTDKIEEIKRKAREAAEQKAAKEAAKKPAGLDDDAKKRIAAEALARAAAKERGELPANAMDRAHAKEKPPEATDAKTVDKAAEKTNTAPSEAQKDAGNYAKGVVKWHGMEIAIENPKGSTRRGKSPDGKEWSVEMPDHYGYVKRTTGADGDQVDVYMGPHPDSEHVIVIHQQTLGGKFDEHKAMLGYKDGASALNAYEKAFSDGRGFDRVQQIETMTPAEFKQWVNSDKPKKAGRDAAKKVPAEVTPEPAPEPVGMQVDNLNRLVNLKTGIAAEPVRSVKLSEALAGLDFRHMQGVSAHVAPFMRKILTKLVGDTDVHVISDADMDRIDGKSTKGYFYTQSKNKQEHGRYIAIRESMLANPADAAHVLLHEGAHDIVNRVIDSSASHRATVSTMMKEVEAAIGNDVAKQLVSRYAFTNEKEFMAEAFGNREFQNVLAEIPVSDALAQRLKLSAKKSTVWDAVKAQVRQVIETVTGKLPESPSMMEAVLRFGDHAADHRDLVEPKNAPLGELYKATHDYRAANGYSTELVQGETSKLVTDVRERVEDMIKRKPMQEQDGRPWFLKVRTLDQVAQAADRYFGRDNNPVRKVADAVEMMRHKATENLRASEPVVEKLYQLEKKYKDGGVWEKFTSLVHDETMAGVFADRDLAAQTHLGKDTLHGAWPKARHAELNARWRELPEDLQQARAESMKFFTDQQNAMSLGIIKNRILKVLGVEDDALAKRIHEGRTVDTDAALVGGETTLELIKEAQELAEIKGPYFPLMRRGTHVVRAAYEIAAPAGAKRRAANEFEFAGKDARDRALAYAKQQDTKPTVKSAWVDPATGETHYPDGTKVTANDTNSEQRFRITVQNEHVDFRDSAREAQELAQELASHGMKVKGVEERRVEADRNSDMLSYQMRTLMDSLQRREGYKDMSPAQKNELVQAINEASLRFLGSTRIQSKRLPRRYVEGASRDLTRNTLEYAQSTAGYLAKLEHQPQIDAALKEMDAGVTNDFSKDKSLGRSAIANEVRRRVDQNDAYTDTPVWSGVTKRMMTLSFVDKLFSPAHNIINSLQPAMVTMPVLSGRYGVGRTFDALSKAYSDVSGFGLIKSGLKNSVTKARAATGETTNLFDQIKANLSTKEREMIDFLASRGAIDVDAGMEIDRLIKARKGVMGKVDTSLGYVEGIARQMPQAIEMMNRSVTALAAYRLELGRGAGHEAAMRKAQETVNNTQGLYSATNSAPIFNHPVAKLSLQFKKYGQMMYHLLGDNIGKAFKGATPEERAEAIKTLAGLTATHVAMAGALGLPTEPFKYLLMGAQAAGLTSVGWGDVEDKVRQSASNFFGKTGGEILTRGLPRAVGLDLSSRVGLDSLASFGEPRSQKETDVKKWMWDTVAGAPVALVGDWVKGMNQLTAGNFSQAAELLVPMKFAADSIRAYRQVTEGKKGSTGKETLSPYNVREAITRAAGFTPAREAEQSAQNSAFYSASTRDKEERSSLMSGWANAKPNQKLGAWKDVQAFNRGKPRTAQITMSELTSYAQRRAKEGNAIRTTKRDKYLQQRAAGTYNP
ncbi:PLxRFG domain-containing protein [Bradyrhizobium sp. 139]|uniref:PLxRFG domain-containing protein n=1 Tax=Bradyrhizobium sp. 139 TaxID=2782616 RepID=UPI001FFA681C|nr:PLxRFG domain-containing protein [Bradyrhizobium sp. 139]MCK1742166.1 PLxRFG domain-containing protein [Bradyrhizobium sp. 139]